jgi:site-specific DNA-methyltransferase (adenine-specific)
VAEQAGFQLRNRNPDVLTCIANLSNDEVFTPPEFANRMLDLIAEAWAADHDGANIWADSTLTYLDPFTKSGVFLREITKRLVEGLAGEFPDLQQRVDHILTKQVFGIGITQLTSLIARRSLYCSKWANGEHSIVSSFESSDGNIWFEPMEHTWVGATEFVETADAQGQPIKRGTNGRCSYCGASQRSLDRDDGLETHAYAFIHTDDIKARVAELFGDDMQFDVIIGNPPYQLADGGQGASAVPIYNKFVEQAKELDPRLLVMIIPSRWFFGGRGLDGFRQRMLSDRRMRNLVDFQDSRRAFDSVDVAGGICYFLWDRDHNGDCDVESHDVSGAVSRSTRPLLEEGVDIFVRSNEGLEVLRKVVQVETGSPGVTLPPDKRFDGQVSGQKPFGLRTYFRGRSKPSGPDDIEVLQSGGRAWMSRSEIEEGLALVDKWKVFTSKSSSEHAGQADRNGMRRVLSLSGVLPPGTAVTETYVLLGTFETEAEARNCYSYAATKFFRYLVATRTSAQDLPRSAYSFVPVQDFSQPWTDVELNAKYGLSADEVGRIDATIRPLEIS